MTPIQTIQIRMSETREKFNGLAITDESLPEAERLRAELVALESELRAAIEADGPASPETREWSDLSSRFDLGEMFTNVMEHRASAGAIAEVQTERGLGGNDIPTEMLMEKRAVTPAPGDVGQNQTEITGFVFPQSVAAFMSIPSPDCPGRRRHIPGLDQRSGGWCTRRERGPGGDDRLFHRRRAHPWPYSGSILLE